MLIRVLLAYRTKLLFGTWWLLLIAKSVFHGLVSSFTSILRSACGFNRLVPSNLVHSFTGVPSLKDYSTYWFGTRAITSRLNGFRDIFDLFQKFRSSLPSSTSSYNTRASTKSATEASVVKASMFSETIMDWADPVQEIIELGFSLMARAGPIAYKFNLKNRLIPKITPKEILCGPGIKLLNEEYFEKYGNDVDVDLSSSDDEN